MRAIVVLLLAASAFPAPRLFETGDLWDLRTAADPQITPNAKRVIYTLTWNDRANDTSHSNLWIVNADAANPRPLTTGPYRDRSPRLSPDGARVAYLSNRSGKTQIRVRWLDGGEDVQVTDIENAPSQIEWSPDGTLIAYQARVPAAPGWSIKPLDKPAGARWADPPTVVTDLRWRADGAPGVTPPGYTHIFTVPATGGAPRQITTGAANHTGGYSWTPDGKAIIFSANRSPDAQYHLDGNDIFSVRIADGAIDQLTRRRGPDTAPAVSPDGTRIAYAGSDWKFQSNTVTRLYVMNRDGSGARLLTDGLDRDVRDIAWSADSRSIHFAADDRGGSRIHQVRLGDGTVHDLTGGKERLGAYAAPGGFSLAADGTMAAAFSSPTEPGDVYVLQPGGARTRLTSVNASLLEARRLGAVEHVSFKSFDGWEIDGWLIKPPDFDPAKKYPLLLDIHGGPHAMYGVEFNHEFQVQAARGFVVLYLNPRGSTGYGEKFGNVIHTHYPGDDYKDLMAGVDHLIARGYIHPARLTVTGGSGGGLLTAWIIGQTTRFAAAVSQYPVTNWISQAGTADGGYTHSALWMKSLPWENPKQFIDHSPIFLARNFKTPTLVLCGEEDWRTPIGQSEELYFALKAMKVPAALVRFPKEPHGIRGAYPSHKIAKMEHILGWMEKWTQ